MEPQLSEREKALRDRFVEEYMIDFDGIKAAIRVGFNKAFAEDYGVKFLHEPYVLRRIEELKHKKLDPEKSEEYDKERIKAALMREAHNPGATASARVQALTTLAKMHGMMEPKDEPPGEGARGGVLMVPVIAKASAWEEAAVASQQALVDNVRH